MNALPRKSTKKKADLPAAERGQNVTRTDVTPISSIDAPEEIQWPELQSPRDFRPWETFAPNVKGVFLYQQAAREIADAEGWSDLQLTALLGQMANAINERALLTRDRKTGARRLPGQPPEFLGLVSVDDVNKWAESIGVLWRWKRNEDAIPAQSVASVALHATDSTDAVQDPPFGKNHVDGQPTEAVTWPTSGEIAFAFRDIVLTQERWQEALKDRKRIAWLRPCLKDEGSSGNNARQATWDPIAIARCITGQGPRLSAQKRAEYTAMLVRRFESEPGLAPFRASWQVFYEDFLAR